MRRRYYSGTGYIIVLLFFLFLHPVLAADAPRQKLKTLVPVFTKSPPRIDGVLDDPVWQGAALVDDVFITYNPIDGQILPQDTKVWLAFDHDNLYFAFYCYDDQPDKIKTSITKRDSIFGDDWVGVAIDPLANHQCLYELFVNPSGMQGDFYNTPATGENSGPDWVWYSSGKMVKDGYTIEIKLPLKSIRFKHGKNISMNILFWRRISRLGMSGAWPALDPGKGSINSTIKVVYGKLNKQKLIEFLPSLVYGSISDLESPGNWSQPDEHIDVGFSAKYGITSAITAELAVNPDFSQVESDAFQIQQNRRYPVFYSEKRPFFMEAGDLFALSGSHENMWTVVHTRKIVDPLWGTRLTGDAGKFTFGVLGAADQWPGREIENEENFYLGEKAYYGIGRVKYGLKGDDYIGMLYTGKKLGDFFNSAYAFDTNLRFGKAHTIRSNFIATSTDDPETGESYRGNAFTGRYAYATKKFTGFLDLEHYDNDFRMDTAFYNRTGISSAQLFLIPVFAVKSKTFSWLNAIRPVFAGRYLYDHNSGLWDRYINVGVVFEFIKQGILTLGWDIRDDESWYGTTYDTSGTWGNGIMQLTKWLNINFSFNRMNHIYYDSEDHYLGKLFSFSVGMTLQPLQTLLFRFSYQYTDFDKKSSGENVYDYHILYSRTVFQPDKHLFFRAIVQYDSFLEQVMLDLLASYEFLPGTVLHLGYGSLHEKLAWDTAEGRWREDIDPREFYRSARSFFFKVGYRLQF